MIARLIDLRLVMAQRKGEVRRLNDVIRLDVGGRLFKTTRATLVSDPDSMLAKMFDPDSGWMAPAKQDGETGTTFIDRNPDAFEVILDFLRTREVFDWPGVSSERVRCEAKYFGLDASLLAEMDRREKEEMMRKSSEPPKGKRIVSVLMEKSADGDYKPTERCSHLIPKGEKYEYDCDDSRYDQFTANGMYVATPIPYGHLQEKLVLFITPAQGSYENDIWIESARGKLHEIEADILARFDDEFAAHFSHHYYI